MRQLTAILCGLALIVTASRVGAQSPASQSSAAPEPEMSSMSIVGFDPESAKRQ